MAFKSYRITCIGCKEFRVSIKFTSCGSKPEFARRCDWQHLIHVGPKGHLSVMVWQNRMDVVWLDLWTLCTSNQQALDPCFVKA